MKRFESITIFEHVKNTMKLVVTQNVKHPVI